MTQQPGKPGEPGSPSEGHTGGAGGMGGTGGAGETTGGAGGPGGTGGASGQNASEKRRNYWMARGVVPRWQLLVVYVWIVGAGLAGFIELGHQQDDIQASRESAILMSCLEQNKRHDETIRELNRIIQRTPPGPERARRERNRAATVALIKALAPKQPCKRRAERLTQ